MTPSLAAFSASALVLVRLGEIIEHGQLSDGHTRIPVTESARQGVYMHKWSRLLSPPERAGLPALRQRVRGLRECGAGPL